MSGSADDQVAISAIIFVLLFPILIIFAGEVQERLRHRGSLLEKPLATLRNYFLPALAALIVVVGMFDVERTSALARVLATAVVATAAIAVLQAIRYAFARAKDDNESADVQAVPRLVNIMPQIVVLVVAGWFLVSVVWDIDLSGLLAALGVTSLVVSLALQPTLSGLASGMLLVSDRPFEPGDWISVDGGIEGVVTDIGWRTSTIQDRNRDVFVIPNYVLSEGTITNFSKPASLHRVVVSLQVAYSNPPSRARAMLLAAARATPGVLEDPEPDIRVGPIDDPLMGYDVHMWIEDYKDSPKVKSDFGALVWYHSNRMGVPLPSPAYDLYHHDPIQEAADAEMSIDEIVDKLSLSSALAPVGRESLVELAQKVKPVRFRAGESVVSFDQPDSDVYLIWQGSARMFNVDNPRALIDIGEGGVVGDMVTSSRLRVPHNVVAVTDCEILVIDGQAAGELAASYPNVVAVWRQIVAIRSARLSASLDGPQGGWIDDVAPGAAEEVSDA